MNKSEIIELIDKGDDAVLSIRNFGSKSLQELKDKITGKGYLQDDSETEKEVE